MSFNLDVAIHDNQLATLREQFRDIVPVPDRAKSILESIQRNQDKKDKLQLQLDTLRKEQDTLHEQLEKELSEVRERFRLRRDAIVTEQEELSGRIRDAQDKINFLKADNRDVQGLNPGLQETGIRMRELLTDLGHNDLRVELDAYLSRVEERVRAQETGAQQPPVQPEQHPPTSPPVASPVAQPWQQPQRPEPVGPSVPLGTAQASALPAGSGIHGKDAGQQKKTAVARPKWRSSSKASRTSNGSGRSVTQRAAAVAKEQARREKRKDDELKAAAFAKGQRSLSGPPTTSQRTERRRSRTPSRRETAPEVSGGVDHGTMEPGMSSQETAAISGAVAGAQGEEVRAAADIAAVASAGDVHVGGSAATAGAPVDAEDRDI